MITIIGLGNPGKEYEGTRHNAGRDAALLIAKKNDFPEFRLNKKANALVSEGKIGKTKVIIALPETFMNKSGNAVAKLVRPKKELRELVVLHDDLDIEVGCIKISFGKNSGGHKGVESVMRAIKTKQFVRIRIGVCPKKKPGTEKQILNFIVGKFSPTEQPIMKKTQKHVVETIETMAEYSLERAMSEFNK